MHTHIAWPHRPTQLEYIAFTQTQTASPFFPFLAAQDECPVMESMYMYIHVIWTPPAVGPRNLDYSLHDLWILSSPGA